MYVNVTTVREVRDEDLVRGYRDIPRDSHHRAAEGFFVGFGESFRDSAPVVTAREGYDKEEGEGNRHRAPGGYQEAPCAARLRPYEAPGAEGGATVNERENRERILPSELEDGMRGREGWYGERRHYRY
jgi:hypothetical protein